MSRRRRLRRESWGFSLGPVCFIVGAVLFNVSIAAVLAPAHLGAGRRPVAMS